MYIVAVSYVKLFDPQLPTKSTGYILSLDKNGLQSERWELQQSITPAALPRPWRHLDLKIQQQMYLTYSKGTLRSETTGLTENTSY